MKKKKVIKIHPEIKSAVYTFLTGFLPAMATQLQGIDVVNTETSALFGLFLVAIRIGAKYGIGNLIKWIVEKSTNFKVE